MAKSRHESKLLPEAPSILAVETGLLGELLVTTPALRAVKGTWPESRVTVLVSPGSAPMLVGNPNVDRLLPLSKRERAGVLGTMRLASWIRAQRFDAALVFHTSFRSALVSFLGGVPVRAGLSCEGRGMLLTHKAPRDRGAYEVDEHLRVVELIGVPSTGSEMELHLTDEERAEARSLLTKIDDRPFVCLHPGASRAIRRWPAERFADLESRLILEPGIDIVYAFGPKEGALAEAVESARASLGSSESPVGGGSRGPVFLFPPTARILGAVFELASAVVTNNTGPMHVAAAVGTPGVFIHGPTPVDRWHPPGSTNIPVFAEDVPCRPCDSPACRRGSLMCMEAVSVERVHSAVCALLGSGA